MTVKNTLTYYKPSPKKKKIINPVIELGTKVSSKNRYHKNKTTPIQIDNSPLTGKRITYSAKPFSKKVIKPSTSRRESYSNVNKNNTKSIKITGKKNEKKNNTKHFIHNQSRSNNTNSNIYKDKNVVQLSSKYAKVDADKVNTFKQNVFLDTSNKNLLPPNQNKLSDNHNTFKLNNKKKIDVTFFKEKVKQDTKKQEKLEKYFITNKNLEELHKTISTIDPIQVKKFNKVSFHFNKKNFNRLNTLFYKRLSDYKSNNQFYNKMSDEDQYICNIISKDISINKVGY